jgi:hypothetical protein
VKRIIKMVAIAMAVVIVLAVSIGSVAMASGPNPEPGTCPNINAGNSGACPNPDCPNECPNLDGQGVCPNPDCPRDGDQLQYRNQSRLQTGTGSAYRFQYRYSQTD